MFFFFCRLDFLDVAVKLQSKWELAVDFKKGVGFKQTKSLEKSDIDYQSLLF